MADARLVVHLLTDRSKFDKGLQGGLGSMKGFVTKAMAIAAPLAAIFSFKAVLEAAGTQARAERKLASVLRATGHAAGFTADQLKRYAGELQRVTNFGDEESLDAMAKLLTFKDLRGDTFKKVFEMGQDITAIFGGSLAENVEKFALAIDDPIKGLGALAKRGFKFTEEQKALMKHFVEIGDLASAQGIIFKELSGQIGGAARDMASPLTQLSGIVGDLAENFGFLILPTIQEIAKETANWASQMDQAQFKDQGESLRGEMVPAIQEVGSALSFVGEMVVDNIQKWRRLIDVVADFAGLAEFTHPSTLPQVEAKSLPQSTAPSDFPVHHSNKDPKFASFRFTADQEKAISEATPEKFEEVVASGREFLAPWFQFGEIIADVTNEAIAFNKNRFDEGFAARREEMEAAAKDLFEITRTAEERYEAERKQLEEMFRKGIIDEDLFRRGMERAAEGLPDDSPRRRELGGAAALDIRSSEAFSVIQAAMRRDAKDPTQEKIAKFQQKSAVSLDKIESNTRKLPDLIDVDLVDG